MKRQFFIYIHMYQSDNPICLLCFRFYSVAFRYMYMYILAKIVDLFLKLKMHIEEERRIHMSFYFHF